VTAYFNVGTKWINECGGLELSKGNAMGCANNFDAMELPLTFNWGDFNARESDFKDPDHGGHNTNWVDNQISMTGHFQLFF